MQRRQRRSRGAASTPCVAPVCAPWLMTAQSPSVASASHRKLLPRLTPAVHVVSGRLQVSALWATETAPTDGARDCVVDSGPSGDGNERGLAPARDHTSTASIARRTVRAHTASRAHLHGANEMGALLAHPQSGRTRRHIHGLEACVALRFTLPCSGGLNSPFALSGL